MEAYSKYGVESFSVANVGTKSILVAIQCEMCLEGWLAGPDSAGLMEQSLEAQRDLDEIGFAPQAWKLSWRLAAYLRRQGDPTSSMSFAEDASVRLEMLCQNLRQSEDVEAFQQLPGPQGFLIWHSQAIRGTARE